MYCKKCGVELPENATFCPACGINQTVEAQKPRRRRKKALFLLIPVVAIILTVLVAINSIIPLWGVNSSPENAAVAAAEAFYEIDIEKLVKTLPDFYIREKAYKYDLPESATRKEFIRAMKSATAGNTALNVDILSSEIIGYLNLSDFLWDYYGMTREEYNLITETAIVSMECILSGDIVTCKATCIKMEHKWYVLTLSWSS